MEKVHKQTWRLYNPNLFTDIQLCSENDNLDMILNMKPYLGPIPRVFGKITTIRAFNVYIPPRLCTTLSAAHQNQKQKYNISNPPLRIILALHGYGGTPKQEMRKWYNTSLSLNTIIIAPQVTISKSFNGTHCRGDPVTKKSSTTGQSEIDDIDFIINGVVDVFLDSFREGIGEGGIRNANVIVTGFNNGAFLASLLGLQGDRPPWLAGIISMGGYQYEIDLYTNKSPLPIMSHHGGRDSVVNPDGCCALGNSSECNCYSDVGIEQKTCTSVKGAFEMWSDINGCSFTVLEDIVSDKRVEKVHDKDNNSIYTCWKGQDCIEPTTVCIWNNEGHSWEFPGINMTGFPGVNMTQSWMEDLFHQTEIRSSNAKGGRDVRKVRIVFSAVVMSSMVLLLIRVTKKKNVGKGRKRTTSEERILEEIELISGF